MAPPVSQEALSARYCIVAYAAAFTLAFDHYNPAPVTTSQGCCVCLRLSILAGLVYIDHNEPAQPCDFVAFRSSIQVEFTTKYVGVPCKTQWLTCTEHEKGGLSHPPQP